MTEREVKRLFSAFPQLAAMHYTDARTPEESEWLLQNSLIVPGFLWQLPEFRRYNDWCQKQDKTSHERRATESEPSRASFEQEYDFRDASRAAVKSKYGIGNTEAE